MEYKIPLFDLNFDKAEEGAVLEVLRSKWISTGPKCSLFESKFSDMVGSGYALSLANCTVALHLAMVVCDIKSGDEVICPSLTFVATVNSIRYVGARPVFADVKSLYDLTIDPVDIQSKITPKTKAIVVMHYGGFACDMDAIMKIARDHNLKVIEDACHAPLSEYNGKKLGTIGDVGCFSFFSNKNISTGEGGMLVTNNCEIYERAKLLRSHGMTSLSYERSKGHSTEYDVVDLGFNYRMDDVRAAIGIVQLDKLKTDLLQRAEVRAHYLRQLKESEAIIIPFLDYTEFSSNYIIPIVLKRGDRQYRDQVRELLSANGIQTSIHYPAVHRFSIYQSFGIENLINTEFLADNLITLPMYSKLSLSEIEFVCKQLTICLNEI